MSELAKTAKSQPPKLRAKRPSTDQPVSVETASVGGVNAQAAAMVGLADAQSFQAAQAYTSRAAENGQRLVQLAADTDGAIAAQIQAATQAAYPAAFEGR